MTTRRHLPSFFLASLSTVLLAVSGCDDSPKKPPLAVALPSDSQQAAPSGDGETEEAVVKVNPAELSMANLYITTKQEKKEKTHSLSLTADGRSDYVEYLVCPLEETGRTCPENTPNCARGGQCDPGVTVYNWVPMPALYAGKILVKARACVYFKNSSTSETCGPYSEHEYVSTLSDAQRAAVEREIQRLRRKLADLTAERYRDALEVFMKESGECEGLAADVKDILDRKRAVVENYMRAPAAWFAQSGLNVADTILGREGRTQAVLDKVEDIAGKFAHELKRMCNAVGDATHDAACFILKLPVTYGEMMLGSLNPISAVATQSVAIHDIYYGTLTGQSEKLVARACYAEQNLQRTVDAIKTEMYTTTTLLREQKKELLKLGN